ncbi:NAD(P)-dependent oxidoreductase [Erythrobacter sp.]|uniref:NAD-dependent epimerase/dehydratase family protein n=1 Tax=Erythrobacter sp. TaxID=1042 RepID=UPI001B1F6C49|nr:NAD(P)-dependent oxidoreductase [Erythrobacter sp.]MBO6526344.1 NAD(P)-dependent oxidoreductase [Erythrobacter sp.]MBO6530597.1 NAD(P)-dependent oxidoreductase [Erythrobacter sp.]
MRVLVTGSSGLIGRWTCDLLHHEGHDVMGIDFRPKPPATADWAFSLCDLLDRKALIRLVSGYAPTHVLHLAARTDLDGSTIEDYAVNVQGMSNLLAAVANTPTIVRAVYTSSQLVCKVGHVPASDDEYLPNTVYGKSKVETERLVREANGGGVIWSLARPTTVWGPHMSDHYKSLITHIEKGRYFHSGRGALYKSYSYVGNIAYQYMRLLEANNAEVNGKVFYLADYEPLSLRDYVNTLSRELGVRQPITIPLALARLLAAVGDAIGALGLRFPYNSFRLNNIRTEYVFDMSLTKSVCGPLPFEFEDGVKATVAWHRSTHNGSD